MISRAELGILLSSFLSFASLSILFPSPMSSPLPLLFTCFAFLFYTALAQVAIPRFTDCFSGNVSLKLNVSTVYAQITSSQSLGKQLNITVLGQSPQVIEGTANGSSDLGASHLLPFHVPSR